MPTLKLSVVQYLNTVPLIWGMLHGEQQGKFDLQSTTPANCADALHQRKVDVGIIPSIEYQRLDRAQILTGMSIAAKNEVKSVLLLCKVPIAKVQTVATDNSSRTSAALLRVLMRKFYSKWITVTPLAPRLEIMLERADAALLIGDAALTYAGNVAEVYDLAAEWKRFTGLPFVFALWVGHDDLNLTKRQPEFAASLEFGLAHLDDIAAEYAPKLGIAPEAVKVYLSQNINYSLDEENRQGLRLFYKLAHEAGITSAQKDLYFA
jgi:predicted solute-binding protein